MVAVGRDRITPVGASPAPFDELRGGLRRPSRFAAMTSSLAFPGGAVWAALPSRPAAACRNPRAAGPPLRSGLRCSTPHTSGLSGRISPPTPLPGKGARFLIGAEGQRMSVNGKRPGADRQEKASLYQEVTDKIIAELEQGRVPWVQPWGGARAVLGLPRNAATGRRYSG